MLRLVGICVLASIFGGFTLWTWRIEQPIAFNHRLHVEDLGSDCTDCHLYAETGVRATIPNIEVCADCHEEAQGESEHEARLVEYIQSEELVPWRKIYRVPDHVYFSHRRHTTLGNLACETCHGRVEILETPLSRPDIDLGMDFCMDCHYQSNVSNDCLLCHR
jgi:hypothetical protein